jgi:hypothetical protein
VFTCFLSDLKWNKDVAQILLIKGLSDKHGALFLSHGQVNRMNRWWFDPFLSFFLEGV